MPGARSSSRPPRASGPCGPPKSGSPCPTAAKCLRNPFCPSFPLSRKVVGQVGQNRKTRLRCGLSAAHLMCRGSGPQAAQVGHFSTSGCLPCAEVAHLAHFAGVVAHTWAGRKYPCEVWGWEPKILPIAWAWGWVWSRGAPATRVQSGVSHYSAILSTLLVLSASPYMMTSALRSDTTGAAFAGRTPEALRVGAVA